MKDLLKFIIDGITIAGKFTSYFFKKAWKVIVFLIVLFFTTIFTLRKRKEKQ